MRATYEKVRNLIVVELSAEEAEKYCAQALSEGNENLQKQGNLYFYTIPCGGQFYQMTQRQKGGTQPWGPDHLRQAIRAAVANHFVTWTAPSNSEEFRTYKSAWNMVFQGLLRNVRLKFPTGKHPRVRMSREEFTFRKSWRAQHVRR